MGKKNPDAESSQLYNCRRQHGLQRPLDGGRGVALVFTLSRYDEDAVAHLLDFVRRQRRISDIILVVDEPETALQNGMLNGLHSLRQRLRLVSAHSQRLAALDRDMAEAELPLPSRSPARTLWYALGYLLTASQADVVAVWGDKVAEQPEALMDLLHPLLSPGSSFQLSKLCPSRSINNNPEAALLAPFAEALDEVFAAGNGLQRRTRFAALQSDGLAFRRALLGSLRLPIMDDLQLALLAEMQLSLATPNVHQVEYQPCGSGMAAGGKNNKVTTGRSYGEFVTVLFDHLRSEGVVLRIDALQTIKLNFQDKALDCLTARRRDCAVSGVEFDEHQAEQLIEHFAEIVFSAGYQFIHGNRILPRLSSWRRASHALPDLLATLRSAIDEDFAELSESPILIPPPPDHYHSARP